MGFGYFQFHPTLIIKMISVCDNAKLENYNFYLNYLSNFYLIKNTFNRL